MRVAKIDQGQIVESTLYRFKFIPSSLKVGINLCFTQVIIYLISCDCMRIYNILKIAELDCFQIIIVSIYVPSTHAYTHVSCLSLDFPYETR